MKRVSELSGPPGELKIFDIISSLPNEVALY